MSEAGTRGARLVCLLLLVLLPLGVYLL
jgi:hypothetical protein